MRRSKMNRSLILLLAVAVMLIITAKTSADSSKEEQAVKDAVSQFYTALNAMFTGDLTLMRQVWSHADDVTYMGPTGGLKVGWNEVLADWQKQASLKLGGKVTPEQMTITVGQELAFTVNYEKGENLVDGKPQSLSIRATNLFRKENSKWKMIGHHTDLLAYLAK